jgi:hypothetical protein
MPGNPRDMITSAERRFPVRIRIGVPLGGLGQRHPQITAWLDENCGADSLAMTPSGTRGVLNDGRSISLKRRSPTLSLRGGALGPRLSRLEASSRCGRMMRRHGSAPGRETR